MPRLYVANRRAKPMVSASGSSTSSAALIAAGGAPRAAPLELGGEARAREGDEAFPAALRARATARRPEWPIHRSQAAGSSGFSETQLHPQVRCRSSRRQVFGEEGALMDAVGDGVVSAPRASDTLRVEPALHMLR